MMRLLVFSTLLQLMSGFSVLAQSPHVTFGPPVLPFPDLFVPTINETSIVTLLKANPAKYLLLQFYVPWCPHCQNFAHDGESLGQVFNRGVLQSRNDASRSCFYVNHGLSSPLVQYYRVNCVASESFCKDAMHVLSYPVLQWAKLKPFLQYIESRLGNTDAPAPSAPIVIPDEAYKFHAAHGTKAAVSRATGVVNWINRRIAGDRAASTAKASTESGCLFALAPSSSFTLAFRRKALDSPFYQVLNMLIDFIPHDNTVWVALHDVFGLCLDCGCLSFS